VDYEVTKFGETPPFGPPTPAKVITLIGPDKDIFLKGRRAENQGLGIGAFAYYRRVVENQTDRLFEAILKLAAEENTDPAIIAQLQKAKQETQFSKAISEIKPGIPEMLKIAGKNPLTLLHTALSQGIHEATDEGCLQVATAIRTVLTQLAERMDAIRKDRSEIQQAVTMLEQSASKLKPVAPPTSPPS
jgi:hypothetical protein